MSFSDLLALTSQLSDPEPEPTPPPPSDAKEDLKELKASLNEIKLVQEAQGVQVSQLLEAMTALARHAVHRGAHAPAGQLLFEPSGSTAQVPPMAQHVSPTNIPVNISSQYSELAAPAVPVCDSLADVNLPLSHANLLTCPGCA
jgi:hypothetical protein